VSFSDGKREGPIRGVGRNAGVNVGGVDEDEKGAVFVPSVRSKRIADMMEDLESAGKWCEMEVLQILTFFGFGRV
jgi:hypothetical protein